MLLTLLLNAPQEGSIFATNRLEAGLLGPARAVERLSAALGRALRVAPRRVLAALWGARPSFALGAAALVRVMALGGAAGRPVGLGLSALVRLPGWLLRGVQASLVFALAWLGGLAGPGAAAWARGLARGLGVPLLLVAAVLDLGAAVVSFVVTVFGAVLASIGGVAAALHEVSQLRRATAGEDRRALALPFVELSRADMQLDASERALALAADVLDDLEGQSVTTRAGAHRTDLALTTLRGLYPELRRTLDHVTQVLARKTRPQWHSQFEALPPILRRYIYVGMPAGKSWGLGIQTMGQRLELAQERFARVQARARSLTAVQTREAACA